MISRSEGLDGRGWGLRFQPVAVVVEDAADIGAFAGFTASDAGMAEAAPTGQAATETTRAIVERPDLRPTPNQEVRSNPSLPHGRRAARNPSTFVWRFLLTWAGRSMRAGLDLALCAR